MVGQFQPFSKNESPTERRAAPRVTTPRRADAQHTLFKRKGPRFHKNFIMIKTGSVNLNTLDYFMKYSEFYSCFKATLYFTSYILYNYCQLFLLCVVFHGCVHKHTHIRIWTKVLGQLILQFGECPFLFRHFFKLFYL